MVLWPRGEAGKNRTKDFQWTLRVTGRCLLLWEVSIVA